MSTESFRSTRLTGGCARNAFRIALITLLSYGRLSDSDAADVSVFVRKTDVRREPALVSGERPGEATLQMACVIDRLDCCTWMQAQERNRRGITWVKNAKQPSPIPSNRRDKHQTGRPSESATVAVSSDRSLERPKCYLSKLH